MIHSPSAFGEASANMQNSALYGAKQLFNDSYQCIYFHISSTVKEVKMMVA